MTTVSNIALKSNLVLTGSAVYVFHMYSNAESFMPIIKTKITDVMSTPKSIKCSNDSSLKNHSSNFFVKYSIIFVVIH